MMRKPLHRRAFLRGIGQGASVAIGMPLLEAMIPSSLIGSAEAAAAAEKVQTRNRLLILYYPNGIHTPNWYPAAPPNEVLNPLAPLEDADYPMSPSLLPLERHRKDFLLLGGLSVPL